MIGRTAARPFLPSLVWLFSFLLASFLVFLLFLFLFCLALLAPALASLGASVLLHPRFQGRRGPPGPLAQGGQLVDALCILLHCLHVGNPSLLFFFCLPPTTLNGVEYVVGHLLVVAGGRTGVNPKLGAWVPSVMPPRLWSQWAAFSRSTTLPPATLPSQLPLPWPLGDSRTPCRWLGSCTFSPPADPAGAVAQHAPLPTGGWLRLQEGPPRPQLRVSSNLP